jgi:hypothetical protein
VPEETPESSTPAPQSGETEQPKGEVEQPAEKASTQEDELPDWARKVLAKVRNEAAGYRTRLRDAETKLSEAKSPEEFETALAEMKARNAELEHTLVVASVARKYDLPEALAGRLRGSTTEELEADAKALQALVSPKVPEGLGGGLDPSEDSDEEMDPRKLARRARRF